MDANARERNVRAHEGLDRIPFPHRIINQMALRRIDDHLKEQESDISDHPRVLDVGCGAGFLLQQMLKRDWDAWGIDPYPRGAALEPPLRERIAGGTVETIDGAGYHAVTAIEVLEHVEDYTGLILSMFRQLLPGGILIVTVPHDWDFQVDIAPNGSLEPRYGHLWRFRITDLTTDLQQISTTAQVSPVYSRTLDRRLFRFTRFLPPSLILRLSNVLIKKWNDGAWLLGTVIKTGESMDPIPESLKPSTAVHFAGVHPFVTGEQVSDGGG